MKNKIRFLSAFVALIMVLGVASVVKANSAELELTSSSVFKAGDTVEVMLRLKSNSTTDGIDNLQLTIDADENFESLPDINADDFEEKVIGQNRWSATEYNAENGTMILSKKGEPAKTESDIVKLIFKVKENTTAEQGTIQVKNISATTGEGEATDEFEISDISITIKKTAGTDEDPETTPTPSTSTTPTPSKSTTPTPSTSGTGTGTDTSKTKDSKLPQTGENTMTIVAVVSAFALVSGISLIRYRKLDI